ncbi:MAG TPA: phosphonate metabolism protein PhnM [Candidatus Pseudogracilibacillus intestinigallinarum]|uniref:Phosphonate metabolism protein PhnM n=1 Tax=Candidatus Pseudogracilibacillus intestinigallinarum TaxID=2838742 RepID=A0A9D1PLR2_9BACI|nr:phosphonate metabolism protein PhnM [Candidatus Pseudogracilibacillus intestinigallinarum]
MYVIHNGLIVTEEKILENHALVIDGKYIHAIVPNEEVKNWQNAEQVDANGAYITPGFIDIHSDYIETISAPRPTSLIDLNISLKETEKILINNGITTMFHSLSLYKTDMFSKNAMRTKENVQRLINLIHETSDDLHLIRHRLHARFEIDNTEGVDLLLENIEQNKVHLISFMDHTPGQGQYRNLQYYYDTIQGYRSISNNEIQTMIAEKQRAEIITPEQIKDITTLAVERNIAVASHDDDHMEKLHLVQSFGTTISEFPITLDVARGAKQLGLYTVVGAPNVLLGKSHSGNLSAVEAIENDCADILCSDYYPSALLHAVFQLHKQYGYDLREMINKVTINPARAVKMEDEIGSIQVGKKADLLMIEEMDHGYPMLTKTMVDGLFITETNYRI